MQRDRDEGVPGVGGWQHDFGDGGDAGDGEWHAGQHDFELRNGDGDEYLKWKWKRCLCLFL